MQPKREKSRTAKTSDRPTAVFRIKVPIIGTELAQHNETFSVVLSNPTDSGGGTPTISGSPATGTIDALFTDGAEVVNFNNLDPGQEAAVAAGAETTDGYGGNDVVTLPSSGAATFTTGSKAGDDYTVNGGDGSYNIVEGAGTETVTISGNGNSKITGGSGSDTVTFTGNGDDTFRGAGGNYGVSLGDGSDTVTINGNGASTITAGSGSDKISITGSGANTINIGQGVSTMTLSGSGNTINFNASSQTAKLSLKKGTTEYINGFVSGDVLDFNTVANLTLSAAFNSAGISNPGEVDIYSATSKTKLAALIFNSSVNVDQLEPVSDGSGGTEIVVDPNPIGSEDPSGDSD